MTFEVFETQKVAVWEATNALRMYAEVSQMPPRLQQAWRDRNSGNHQWRDIPLVIEAATKKRFEDTFSAETVMMESFFPQRPQTFVDEPAVLPDDASGELEIKTSYERVNRP